MKKSMIEINVCFEFARTTLNIATLLNNAKNSIQVTYASSENRGIPKVFCLFGV